MTDVRKRCNDPFQTIMIVIYHAFNLVRKRLIHVKLDIKSRKDY